MRVRPDDDRGRFDGGGLMAAAIPAADDDFTPISLSQEGETKPWSEVIRMGIELALREMHIALPARVLAAVPGMVTVQPLLKAQFADGTLADLPPILNVPVCAPRGATYFIQLPVFVGDTGLLIFSERSLDLWKVSTGAVSINPLDTRMHDLSDAVFIPGLYPITVPAVAKNGAPDPTALIVNNGIGEIWVTKAGQFRLGTAAADFLKLTQQLAAAVTALNTAMATGGPITTPAQAVTWANGIYLAATSLVSTLATLTTALTSIIAVP